MYVCMYKRTHATTPRETGTSTQREDFRRTKYTATGAGIMEETPQSMGKAEAG